MQPCGGCSATWTKSQCPALCSHPAPHQSLATAAHILPALLPARWNSTLQTLVASFEAYEDLMKKSQEGKDFYADLESKVAALLARAQSTCQAREAARQQLLDRWVWRPGLGVSCSPDPGWADGGLAPLPYLALQRAEEEAATTAHSP